MAVLFWVIVLLILCFGTMPVIEWIQRWPGLIPIVQHWLSQKVMPTVDELLVAVGFLVLIVLIGKSLYKGLLLVGDWISPPSAPQEKEK
jgi:hypothetical protein